MTYAASDWRPGDLALVHSPPGITGRLIAVGERIAWWRLGKDRWPHPDRPPWWGTHAALLHELTPDGWTTLEAQGDGIGAHWLDDHASYVVLPAPLDNRGRDKALAFAKRWVGTPYGFLTDVSIGLDQLTPRAIRFRSRKTLICSEYVARSWECGGWLCPQLDIGQVMPAQLDWWVTASTKATR